MESNFDSTLAPPGQLNTLNAEDEEARHFKKCISAMKSYKKDFLQSLKDVEINYSNLSQKHKELLPNHLNHVEEIKTCVERNQIYLDLVVEALNCSSAFTKTFPPHTSFDISKVKSTLKQIARDWSAEGDSERQACYDPIIKEIQKYKPLHDPENQIIKVYVPGCGLGRLAWELARLGYCSVGNEFSFYMLFVSNHILNNSAGNSATDFHQFKIHPWIDQRCNVKKWQDVSRLIKFPDVFPDDLPHKDRFQMFAGDFLEISDTANEYDCVACCFFLDTAHNIITYLEKIFFILKPGGILVNLGPLLYHFSSMNNEPSIELSYEDLLDVLPKIGFKILKTSWINSSYTENKLSMLKYEYDCGLFVCQKLQTNSS